LKIPKNIEKIYLTPEQTFAAVNLSRAAIFAPSGFYHLSRYMCKDANICLISDWTDKDYSLGKDNKFKVKNERQERILKQEPINQAYVIKVIEKIEVGDCVNKIESYLNNLKI
jgi:hypothetical protein